LDIISSNNARNLAFVLLGASLLCIIVGVGMKNDLNVQTGYADAACQPGNVQHAGRI
jgi:hypothetical protein